MPKEVERIKKALERQGKPTDQAFAIAWSNYKKNKKSLKQRLKEMKK